MAAASNVKFSVFTVYVCGGGGVGGGCMCVLRQGGLVCKEVGTGTHADISFWAEKHLTCLKTTQHCHRCTPSSPSLTVTVDVAAVVHTRQGLWRRQVGKWVQSASLEPARQRATHKQAAGNE